MSELLTPSQTVGPYFSMRLPWPAGPYVVPDRTRPARSRSSAGCTTAPATAIPDGLIETWQADPNGRFAHPDDPRGPILDGDRAFRGFGRCPTDHDGSFKIVTLKPGPLPFGDGRTEAPHIDVSVFSRGMLDRSVTRIYFPDEARRQRRRPGARGRPGRAAAATLIAVPGGDGLLRFDIHLQGPSETVFFDL